MSALEQPQHDASCCPECGGRSSVTQTRARERKVWRRRCCESCGHLWSTVEMRAETAGRLESIDKALARARLIYNP